MKAMGLSLLVFGFTLIVVLAWRVERKAPTVLSTVAAILGSAAIAVSLVVGSRLIGGLW